MELQAFRTGLDEWLDQHEAELAPENGAPLDVQMRHLALVRRLTYDAGWMRWGWPEHVSGFGGSTLLRGYMGEALAIRGLVEPGIYSVPEVLGPTMISFAPAGLAEEMVPRLLRGDETWCQGFSEPGTGSNLASLSCRAVADGDAWHVTGQKLWTSLAQFADRCVLLTRTGAPESAHQGITALFVDMDSPGISVRPLRTMHGEDEFCEVFFDDVRVPLGRTLGEVNGGWSVAMDLLPYERSTSLWHKGAYLHERLDALLATAREEAVDAGELGRVAQQLFVFRAHSRATQYRLARGEKLGPETSVDKLMVAAAEQEVLDLAEEALGQAVAFGDGVADRRWRSEFLFSRAASIYGGSVEIQRNILARRVLQLGPDLGAWR